MAVIDDLIVKLTADPSAFIKGIGAAAVNLDTRTKQMVTALDRLDNRVSAVGRTFGKFLPFIGTAGLTVFSKRVLDAADQLKSLSEQTGVSTEALSEYQFVIQQTSEDFDGFIAALQSMKREVSDATAGVEAAQKTFRTLGLDARNLIELSPDQMFEQIADAMRRVGNDSDKAALAVSLFGKQGLKLIQVMDGGAESIRKLRAEARQLGLTLTGEDAAAIDQFNDEIRKMEAVVTSAWRKGLLPLVKTFNDLVSGAKEARRAFHQFRYSEFVDQLQRIQQGKSSIFGSEEQAREAIAREEQAMDALSKKIEESNQQWDRYLQLEDSVTRTRRESTASAKAEKEALEDATKAAQIYVHATEEIQDALAEAFVSGENAAERFKAVALSIFKEIAAAALIRPVIAPIVSGVAGAIGGDMLGAAVAKELGVSGKGFGVKDIISSLGTSWAGKGVSSLASSALGINLGAMGAGLATAGLGTLAAFALPQVFKAFKGTPHPASTFGTTLSDTGAFTATQFKSKHQSTEAAKSIGAMVEQMTAGLVTAGINLAGTRIHGGVDVGKGGGFLQIEGGKMFNFNPEDEESFQAAIKSLGQELLSLAGETRDLETVLSEAAKEEERRMEILAEQNRFLNQLTDGYVDAARNAEKLALDFRKMSQDLMKTLYDLRVSSGSALSPEEIYALAAERFRSTRDKALAGDTEAMAALPDAARDFAEISREFNASNAQFKQDFAEVEAALISTSNLALSFEQEQLDIARQQLAMLDKIRAALEAQGKDLDLSKLVKPGEDLSVLSGINPLNNLPELLVRLEKLKAGFDFSSGMLFRDFARMNPAAGAAFNAAIQALGGTPQAFAEGGFPRLGVPMLVGEKGPEVYMPTASGQVIPNNRLTVSNADPAEMTETLSRGFSQLIGLTAKLVDTSRRQSEQLARLESRMLARGSA